MPMMRVSRRKGVYALSEAWPGRAVYVPEELMAQVEGDPTTETSQSLLRPLYESAGWTNQLWSIFRTENAFWHIQGIITTATLFFAIVFPIGRVLGWGLQGPFLPVNDVRLFAFIAIGTSLFSFYALIKRKRPLKKRAAWGLFTGYLFYLLYFIIEGIPNVFQFLTTIAFAWISLVLYREWSK
jgi:predicted membrane channel-forming protein YqfA (hemolysin III family)